ncbi:hypothetical protein AMTRI_Chr01g113070 [Amborella trichopoda]|uniref:FAF domain-containing protein n=1 Tax=Amborella trichopoda TaxID=13333 RepID=W1PRR9_AMBTC|nr:protein FANTASTIC FOUR 1 [Amborella trichopoda]ERN12697.1 hypothetical protein AMTR_s00025p00249720 [Amborella trichopoda]|eukprot:XP_006851116.1 protein FANTASTIC FOUR 1 [Amborella trichopoda]
MSGACQTLHSFQDPRLNDPPGIGSLLLGPYHTKSNSNPLFLSPKPSPPILSPPTFSLYPPLPHSLETKTTEETSESQTSVWKHPAQTSLSKLSTKSLELCTESLGSETGTRCGEDWLEGEEMRRERKAVSYRRLASSKNGARLFPPPLPSIAGQNGPCLHVKSHRKDGRLVMKAVMVRSQSYLLAEREGGRLRLRFMASNYRETEGVERESEEDSRLETGEVRRESAESRCGSGVGAGGEGQLERESEGLSSGSWGGEEEEEERENGSEDEEWGMRVNEVVNPIQLRPSRCKEGKGPLIWEPFCVASS